MRDLVGAPTRRAVLAGGAATALVLAGILSRQADEGVNA